MNFEKRPRPEKENFGKDDNLAKRKFVGYDLLGILFEEAKLDRTVFDFSLSGLRKGVLLRKIFVIAISAFFLGFSTGYWVSFSGTQIILPSGNDGGSLIAYRAIVVTLLLVLLVFKFFFIHEVQRKGINSRLFSFIVKYATIPIPTTAVIMSFVAGTSYAVFILTLLVVYINTAASMITLTIAFVIARAISKSTRGFRLIKYLLIYVAFALGGLIAQFYEAANSFNQYSLEISSSEMSFAHFWGISYAATSIAFFLILKYSQSIAGKAIRNEFRHRAIREVAEYLVSQGATKFKGVLNEVSFVGAKLRNVDFSEVDEFRKVDWAGASLDWAYFKADLSFGLLKGVPIHDKKICELVTCPRKADVKLSISCENLNLAYVNLSERNLSEICLKSSILDQGRFHQTNFDQADLNGLTAVEADFSEACFKNAGLEDAKLSRSLLVKTDFTNAKLNNSDLAGIQLDGSLCVHATFKGANLTNASLQRVDLTHANLSRADLSGADLRSANLTGVVLDGTLIDSRTIFSEVGCSYVVLGGEHFPQEGEYSESEFSNRLEWIRNSTGELSKLGYKYFPVDYFLRLEESGRMLIPENLPQEFEEYLKRIEVTQILRGLPPAKFEEIVYALNPGQENMPDSLLSRKQRFHAFLIWMQSNSGPSPEVLKELIRVVG